MDKDVLINRLRVIINHLPFMSSERQVLAISNANCLLDAYFLTEGKFIKTYARDCMPINKVVEDNDTVYWCEKCGIGREEWFSHCDMCGSDSGCKPSKRIT